MRQGMLGDNWVLLKKKKMFRLPVMQGFLPVWRQKKKILHLRVMLGFLPVWRQKKKILYLLVMHHPSGLGERCLNVILLVC
jgi:hypothetical protein